jgi:hypothetical protein
MAFQTKITRARFVVGPFPSETMQAIGQAATDSISARIRRGLNVQDDAAKPLKPGRNGRRGYPDYKVARGLQGIRDLVWRGMTMRSLRVISAKDNEVRIGFDNPQAAQIAAINQNREAMFWFSPANKQLIQRLVSAALANAEAVRARDGGATPERTQGRDELGRFTRAA